VSDVRHSMSSVELEEQLAGVVGIDEVVDPPAVIDD
jgi:hypothetical protein